MNADVDTIFRVVVAVGAIVYVLFGPPVPRPDVPLTCRR